MFNSSEYFTASTLNTRICIKKIILSTRDRPHYDSDTCRPNKLKKLRLAARQRQNALCSALFTSTKFGSDVSNVSAVKCSFITAVFQLTGDSFSLCRPFLKHNAPNKFSSRAPEDVVWLSGAAVLCNSRSGCKMTERDIYGSTVS